MRQPDPTQLLTLPELAQILGRHRQSTWRWARQGYHGEKLQTEMVRGVHYTTWRWYCEFRDRLERSGARMNDL